MSGFASVENAARVRDLIKRSAGKVVADVVPGELVGRVVSLDLPRRTARVWFTGDEQPVGVKLFSDKYPGQWQSQLQPGMTANTNLAGYGSMVVCQKFRGELYITDVLSGGQFSYDLVSMNQNYVSTLPYDVSPNSVFGKMIAGKFHVSLISELNQGESLEFGPFIKTDDSDASNWAKIYINIGSASLEYEFNISDIQFLGPSSVYLNRWFRLIPVRETSINRFNQRELYDFDISIRRTQYGTNPNFGFQSDEYWFRLVKRASDTSFISANVSIETSLFNKPRSIDGNERLIQTRVTSTSDILGFVGFHNSGHNVDDLADIKIRDNFDRALTGLWGNASDGTTWSNVLGSGSNYLVANNKGQIAPTAADVFYSQINSRVEYDFDCIVKVSPNQVATGSGHSAWILFRRTASNNSYRFHAEFLTTGMINVGIDKLVAGAHIPLANAAGVTSYSANSEVWIRAQIRNSRLKMKLWSTSAVQPLAWNLTILSDTSLTVAGNFEIGAYRSIGNTNSSLVTSFSNLECNVSQQVNTSTGTWATGPWRSGVLRTAQDLQETWTLSGGNFSFDGTNFGWTGEILLTGIGRHRNGLADGLMYITCPKNPTEYVIPVFGSSAPTTINVSTSGIPLAPGRSLYVSVPPGERNVDLMENLFLVDSSVGGVDFQLPEWAIFIAHRELLGTTQVIRLGNGEWPVNEVRFEVVGAGPSSVSTVYSSLTGGTFNFTKHRTNTKLELDVRGSSFAGGAGDVTEFALQIDGTDYHIVTFLHNAANRHDSWSGIKEVAAGIPAGTYVVTLRYRRASGGGSITVDSSDRLTGRVRELPL